MAGPRILLGRKIVISSESAKHVPMSNKLLHVKIRAVFHLALLLNAK
jgi:hypothetical protein